MNEHDQHHHGEHEHDHGAHDHGAHDHGAHDHGAHDHGDPAVDERALTAMALKATRHCLTGCAIGEVLGMVIGTALGWHAAATVMLAVALAFFFGYLLTIVPLLRAGMALAAAIPITLAVDTLSITIMEIVDNAVMLAIPGAMDAGPTSVFFWGSLAFALAVAFVAAYPANRWLISKGRGHALVHHMHH